MSHDEHLLKPVTIREDLLFSDSDSDSAWVHVASEFGVILETAT